MKYETNTPATSAGTVMKIREEMWDGAHGALVYAPSQGQIWLKNENIKGIAQNQACMAISVRCKARQEDTNPLLIKL